MDISRKLYPLEKCWNCFRIVFCILPCLMSLAALGLLAVEFYFDDIERIFVIKRLILTNSSQTFKVLTEKTITDVQVHLFNVTNRNDVENSREKPILQIVGPYVYRREATKTNVTFTNECASQKCLEFSEFSQFFFNANKSSRFPENDTITIPNIVKVATKNTGTDIISGMLSWAVALGKPSFIDLTAHDLMWGFSNSILTLAHMANYVNSPTIGLLRDLNNSLEGPFTVNTGEDDITKLGQMEAFKNMTTMNTWDSEYADMINGTTDVVSPPGVKLGDKRYIFCPGLCRSFSFTATETVFSKDVPHLKLIKMTFDKEQLQSVEENPDNSAFNDKDRKTGKYPPSGFLSLSRCVKFNFSIPIFISLPYFHLVENETRNGVIFDSPTEPNLEPYYLLDPKSGFLVGANIHYQINIYISKDKLGFSRDMFIPLAYIKSIISAEKKDVQKLYDSAYKIPVIIRGALRSTIALLLVMAFMLFVFTFYLTWIERRMREVKSREEHPYRMN